MTVRGIIASAIAACLLTSSIAVRAQAGSDHAQAIDRLVTSFASNHHIPGLSVAVIDRGRVLLARGYGLSDLENQVPATADTVYRIASVSKSITATAAPWMVDARK